MIANRLWSPYDMYHPYSCCYLWALVWRCSIVGSIAPISSPISAILNPSYESMREYSSSVSPKEASNSLLFIATVWRRVGKKKSRHAQSDLHIHESGILDSYENSTWFCIQVFACHVPFVVSHKVSSSCHEGSVVWYMVTN